MKSQWIGLLIGFAIAAGAFLLGMHVCLQQSRGSSELDAKRLELLREELTLVRRMNRWLEGIEAEFTGSCSEARNSALVSDLQTVRSQLELYDERAGMPAERQ